MKSVIQEASSLAKAIEQGWEKAGKPKILGMMNKPLHPCEICLGLLKNYRLLNKSSTIPLHPNYNLILRKYSQAQN